ncbi:hypothetical protein QOT17_003940 [Balamuthia mandrillaris]
MSTDNGSKSTAATTAAAAKKGGAAAAAAKEKKERIVPFDVTKLDSLKHKRLQSLCKRAGIKANEPSEKLREELKKYHTANKKAIEAAIAENQKKKSAPKKKSNMTATLEEKVHYKPKMATYD